MELGDRETLDNERIDVTYYFYAVFFGPHGRSR